MGFVFCDRSSSGHRVFIGNSSSSPHRTSFGGFWCQLLSMWFWEFAGKVSASNYQENYWVKILVSVNVNSIWDSNLKLVIIMYVKCKLYFPQQHPRGIMWISFNNPQDPSKQTSFYVERRDILRENEVLHPSNIASQKGSESNFGFNWNPMQTFYHSICHDDSNRNWNESLFCRSFISMV